MATTSTTTTKNCGSIGGPLTLTITALCLLWTTSAVFTALQDVRIEAGATRAVQSERTSVPSRPELCQEFYNNGTSQWARCMGVGKK